MHQHSSSNQPQSDEELPHRFSVPIKIVLLVLIGIVVYFLVIEHRARDNGRISGRKDEADRGHDSNNPLAESSDSDFSKLIYFKEIESWEI